MDKQQHDTVGNKKPKATGGPMLPTTTTKKQNSKWKKGLIEKKPPKATVQKKDNKKEPLSPPKLRNTDGNTVVTHRNYSSNHCRHTIFNTTIKNNKTTH